LNSAVANAFDIRKGQKNVSVIVIHKDRIIAEIRYWDKDSKILGWSMTKSITATILEYLKNRENMIYPNQLNNGVAAR
jgi:hypothetical protein